MLDPKRVVTRKFATGFPALSATHRGMTAFTQNAAITSRVATNP